MPYCFVLAAEVGERGSATYNQICRGEDRAAEGKPLLKSGELWQCVFWFNQRERSRQRTKGGRHRRRVKETQRDRQKPYKTVFSPECNSLMK